MRKWMKALLAASALTLSMSFPSLAGQWHEDMVGTWFEEDDGSYLSHGWHWADGDHNGIAECYYFDNRGYVVKTLGTVDGYDINKDGAWTVGGVVQTKDVALPNDPAALELYKTAVEKNKELNSVDADVDAKITMSAEGESIDMAMKMTLKMRDMKADAPEYVANGSVDLLGSSMDFSMFYTDGYLYMDMLGMKVKQPMPAMEAVSEVAEIQSLSNGEAEMMNLQMYEDKGYQVLTYEMKTGELNKLLDEIIGLSAGDYEELGYQMQMSIKKAKGTVVIDSNGYYVRETVAMDMNLCMTDVDSGESESMDISMDMVMNINNAGKEVTFKLPSKEGYVDVTEY
ncbi:MAG: hypothetical protein HFE83_02540 [Lachnospiraceae bacterium]|jgi:hypothetical protein|nr:hypothetical protein [Lachnospiraceae bacterium]